MRKKTQPAGVHMYPHIVISFTTIELELLFVPFSIYGFLSFISFIDWVLHYSSVYLVIPVKFNGFTIYSMS